MATREQLQKARAGQSEAIAALLNTALESRNITAQVQRCGDELQILLESSTIPPQQEMVEFVRQGLQRLQLTSITTIALMGQKRGYLKDHWQVTFELYGTTVTPLTEGNSPPSVSPRSQPSAPAFGASSTADPVVFPASVNPPAEPVPSASLAHIHASGNRSLSQGVPAGQRPTTKATLLSSAETENLPQLLGIGVALGGVIAYLPVTSFLLHPLIVLVHEFGHAFAAWLLGYPAIPAFDFVHGGGVTAHFNRASLLIYLIYIGLAFLYYRYRKNYLTLRLLLVMTVVYSVIAFLPAHEDIVTAMGHAFELLFIIIFGFQGLSGFGCRGRVEQSLYLIIAFYMWFSCLGFGWQLIADTTFRANYLSGKGGLVHDFVILAGQYAGGNLIAIAIAFLLAGLAVPPLTWLLYRHRDRMARIIHRFWFITNAPRFSW